MSIDYRFNAAARIKVALDPSKDEDQALTIAQIATAEATLALVEQQRIANLISVYTATGEVESGSIGAGIDFGHIAAQIKEGLGL